MTSKAPKRVWDTLLLTATAVGVVLILAFVTATFARSILNSPWMQKIPADVLGLFTFIAIVGTMVLCFMAFFRGRRDANRPALPPAVGSGAGLTRYPELAVVRTLVAKTDERGRPVKAGTIGTIVHVHPTAPSTSAAYIVEVVIADKQGMQVDAHLFDALHEELELRQEAGRK